MTRAIGYLRVSTDLQAEKGMGLAVQRERVTEYAEREGVELVDVVQEAASGGVRNGELFSWEHRPILLDVLERAKAGEFELLIVARFDRLSRDHATLTIIERMLGQHGVRVVSTDEENGDGPIAEYVRGNMALIAQLDRALIRQRLAAGKAQKRRRGEHVSGKPPFGYRLEDGKLAIDVPSEPERNRQEAPEESTEYRRRYRESPAGIVRRIFEEAGKHGSSPARIARDLNAEQVPSPRGGAWNRKVIGDVLRNPAYVGELHGVKNAHPAIVSRRLWNAANEALRARARRQDG
jgi:site-specific DNA recombinase